MIEINGKIYRNLQEQVEKNKDDIAGLQQDLTGVYTKTETDTLLDGKADTSAVYTKTEIDMTLVNKANVDDVYTKNETDTLLNEKANTTDVYSKTETDTLLNKKANTTSLPHLYRHNITIELVNEGSGENAAIDITFYSNDSKKVNTPATLYTQCGESWIAGVKHTPYSIKLIGIYFNSSTTCWALTKEYTSLTVSTGTSGWLFSTISDTIKKLF